MNLVKKKNIILPKIEKDYIFKEKIEFKNVSFFMTMKKNMV